MYVCNYTDTSTDRSFSHKQVYNAKETVDHTMDTIM